jgi:hypothetical protein
MRFFQWAGDYIIFRYLAGGLAVLQGADGGGKDVELEGALGVRNHRHLGEAQVGLRCSSCIDDTKQSLVFKQVF